MEPKLYPGFIDKMLTASINWRFDDIRVCLVNSQYVYKEAHSSLDNVVGFEIPGSRLKLTGRNLVQSANLKTVSIIADNVLYSGLQGSFEVGGAIVYCHQESTSASSLLLYFDLPNFSLSADGVQLQFAPEGIFAIGYG